MSPYLGSGDWAAAPYVFDVKLIIPIAIDFSFCENCVRRRAENACNNLLTMALTTNAVFHKGRRLIYRNMVKKNSKGIQKFMAKGQ